MPRKKAPATLRTLGLFNGGQTPLEEAEQALKEDGGLLGDERVPADRSYEGTQAAKQESAARWYGLDTFAEGDDVFVLAGDKGAVLTLVYAKKGHAPHKTVQLKLSAAQWKKLRELAGEML